MINKDKGGGQFLDFMGGQLFWGGDIELMGAPPSPLPTRENPVQLTEAVQSAP